MKSIASVIKLKPNVFMESIDSKDACLSVPIPLEHQKYSKFFFQQTGTSNVYGLLVYDYENFYKIN